jgi:hypothetical protein
MTARNTTLTYNQLNARSLRFIDLVKIVLPNKTLLVTNYEQDVTITTEDGSTTETFLTGKGYLYHSDIVLASNLDNNTVNLVFDSVYLDSAADTPGTVFANSNYAGAPVTIRKALVDVNSDITNFIIFKGIVDSFTIKITNNDSLLNVVCGGPFANFDKTVIYGYTNTKSQNRLYPDDLGFEFSQNNVRNITWSE